MIKNFFKRRNLHFLKETESMSQVLKKLHLAGQVFLKGYYKKVPIRIEIISEDKVLVHLPFDYRIKETLTLYAMLSKYVELKMKYIQTVDVGQHLCSPE